VKAFGARMMKDHKTDVSDFEKQAKSGKDADLQAFAGKMLPRLQEPLKMVEGIHDALK